MTHLVQTSNMLNMGEKAENLNRLMGLLGGAAEEGGSFAEVCKALSIRKNKQNALAFSRTEYSDRLVLVPQCLRSTKDCKAEEDAAEYRCVKCGACKVAAIVERAEELGYKAVRILKGGSAVSRLITELKPKAVLGVACNFEGALGILECERNGIVVQFVSLLNDGCADTDVELDEVMEVLEFRQP